LAAKKLGARKVGLLGCIGKDFSQQFSCDMREYEIEASMDASGSTTGGFHLIYDRNGNRTLDVLGAAGKIKQSNLPEEFLDSAFILIGPILGEVDLELIQFLRSASSAKIFLDPQGLVRKIGDDGRIVHACDREEIRKIIETVDFVKPNEQEIEIITGERDPLIGLKRLRSMGSAVPIVTLAERGSLLLDGNRLFRVPPFVTTHAIDPTGAGDVYAGSFITEYTRTGNLSEAVIFASAAASLMVEQVGPNFRLDPKEVQQRKEAIRSRLTVETLR
jgi:sugar/nucleoside kinase (ribokinase family)